ncbi:unnamed protein product [Lasius platythorax]|uniref:Uncharacterized protein n=2 Tax=Lasius TaxID=488720 RepID=A0A0J7K1L2_LASNI|nr:hypothetical protein RF55_17927 [Lasius niger]
MAIADKVALDNNRDGAAWSPLGLWHPRPPGVERWAMGPDAQVSCGKKGNKNVSMFLRLNGYSGSRSDVIGGDKKRTIKHLCTVRTFMLRATSKERVVNDDRRLHKKNILLMKEDEITSA